jgi:hypothetical protein
MGTMSLIDVSDLDNRFDLRFRKMHLEQIVAI